MILNDLDKLIARTLGDSRLPNSYRKDGQLACIYNFIPGQSDRRFFASEQTSFLENITEVIVTANNQELPQDNIIHFTRYLIGAASKGDNMTNTILQQIIDYCAHCILKPVHYTENFRPSYKAEKPTLQQKEKKELTKIINQFNINKLKELQISGTAEITSATRAALAFVAFIGEDSTTIKKSIKTLKQNLIKMLDELRPGNNAAYFEVAAYVHHEMIRIHPYVDGNGRVARALMNAVLVEGGLKPLDIKGVPSLENKYDQVVGRLDTHGFSQWLSGIYFSMNPNESVEKVLDVQESTFEKAECQQFRAGFFNSKPSAASQTQNNQKAPSDNQTKVCI